MMRKYLNRISSVLMTAGCLVILMTWIPYLFRIRPQIVLSGSMEPEIPVGSMAYISEHVLPEEVRNGDVIAYQLGESMNVLHRVIQTDSVQKVFRTKGDANQQEDFGAIKFSQYRGKELFCIPYMGYVVRFLQTKQALFCVGGVLAVLAALEEIVRWREGEKNREKNDADTESVQKNI